MRQAHAHNNTSKTPRTQSNAATSPIGGLAPLTLHWYFRPSLQSNVIGSSRRRWWCCRRRGARGHERHVSGRRLRRQPTVQFALRGGAGTHRRTVRGSGDFGQRIRRKVVQYQWVHHAGHVLEAGCRRVWIAVVWRAASKHLIWCWICFMYLGRPHTIICCTKNACDVDNGNVSGHSLWIDILYSFTIGQISPTWLMNKHARKHTKRTGLCGNLIVQ